MKTLLLFYCLLLNAIVSQAQDSALVTNPDPGKNEVSRMDASLTFQLGIPTVAMQRAIENHMGNLGFGASLLLASNPFTWGSKAKNAPLRLGAEIGYTYYGRFISYVTINGYTGDYKTSYGIANLNAIVRFRPPATGNFNPFVDVIAGGNFYLSSTTENLDVIESALGIEKLDFGGTTSVGFNKGIGFGFTAGSSKTDRARFVLRATYNRGSSIKYVVRNSLSYDPGSHNLIYQRGSAPVEYFMIQVGIGI
jgi:hypothetical protein